MKPLIAEDPQMMSLFKYVVINSGGYFPILLSLGVVLLVGAIVVIVMSRRTAILAAYVPLTILPALIGMYGTAQAFFALGSSLGRMDDDTTVRPAVMMTAWGTSFIEALLGLGATLPAFTIASFALFIRVIKNRSDRSPSGAL